MNDERSPDGPADSGGAPARASGERSRAAQPDATMSRLAALTSAEYRVERELGRGGMATVYLAHDIALDRKVAIKVMSADLFAAGDVLIDRFMREARTGARLNHPHIIPVYAVREAPDLIYFVMKFIDGKPLDDVIRTRGPLPIPLVARILAQVSDALAYAHRNGIVHRDIKPGNLMLDKDGWVVLTDLGIAKVQEAAMLTATGSTIGTPTYMSPEQSMAAKETGGASDQYSLGCVAFEMLTGQPPFSADSVVALIWKHHTEPPPSLQKLRPDCPPEMVAAITRMLQKSPEDRFGGMEEVTQLFRDASSGDEEEFRLLVRAFATGEGQTQAVARINNTPARTPVPRSSIGVSRTPGRPVSREIASVTTATSSAPQDGPPLPGSTNPTPIPSSAAAGAAAPWPRTLLRGSDAPTTRRRFRMPGVLTLACAGVLVWYLAFPRIGPLKTAVPTETALMRLRAAEADAAVRRGQATGPDGACEGVRLDLPSCRRQVIVPLSAMAPVLVQAVVAAQDSMFERRQGADWVAMRRAAGYPRDAFEWTNGIDRADVSAILPRLSKRMEVVGRVGSLSQRLAQNLWYPPDDGVYRKLREIRAANRLADGLGRDRLLEVYLNVAEFGPGLYGVEAAAQAYFNVGAKSLTKSQAAALAATLASPRRSTPLLEPAAMRRRQQLILRRLGGEAVGIPAEWDAGQAPATAAPPTKGATTPAASSPEGTAVAPPAAAPPAAVPKAAPAKSADTTLSDSIPDAASS